MSIHKMSSQKASLVKKLGHNAEVEFNLIFGGTTLQDLNLSGSSEDCFIDKKVYKKLIQNQLNYYEENLSVSLKSAKTWQFHLGRIDEISTLDFIKSNISTRIKENGKNLTIVKYSNSFDKITQVLRSVEFWKRYLKKGNLLCYNDKKGNYTFFEMNKVIKCIIDNFEWRILESGRIKGDCIISEKLKKGVLTIEFRNELHKQCLVLGAHGGKENSANGYRLFLFLKEKIKYSLINPLN